MFDVSVVTCMAGWIEIEIILLVILKSSITAVLMYFTIVLDWIVYRNYYFITLCG